MTEKCGNKRADDKRSDGRHKDRNICVLVTHLKKQSRFGRIFTEMTEFKIPVEKGCIPSIEREMKTKEGYCNAQLSESPCEHKSTQRVAHYLVTDKHITNSG